MIDAKVNCVGEYTSSGARYSAFLPNIVVINGMPKARVFCDEQIIAAPMSLMSMSGKNNRLEYQYNALHSTYRVGIITNRLLAAADDRPMPW